VRTGHAEPPGSGLAVGRALRVRAVAGLLAAVAFVVAYYGVRIIRKPEWRWPLIVLFSLAFIAAAVAGLFGAFITKAAPVA